MPSTDSCISNVFRDLNFSDTVRSTVVRSYALGITGTPVTSADDGSAYAGFTVYGFAGVKPYAYSFIGSPPSGITVDATTGVVSGTPSVGGTFSGLSIRVTDFYAVTADLPTFTLVVASAAVGTAAGMATVSGVGATGDEATGSAAGSATVTGVGASIAAATGTSVGSAIVTGESFVETHRYWRVLVSTNDASRDEFNIAELYFYSVIGGSRLVASANLSNPELSFFGSGPDSAFDNDVSTIWQSRLFINPAWIGCDFGSALHIAQFKVTSPTTSPEFTWTPTQYVLQYSDDGSSWTTYWTSALSTGWAAGETRTFTPP